MTRADVVRKVDELLTEFEKNGTFGLIEIQISAGIPALLRRSTTEKLQPAQERNHRAYHSYQR